MTMIFGKNLAIFALAVAAICTTACNRDRAAVGTTETTSAEVELNTVPTTTIGHKDDYLATVRREQLVLRGRIDEELKNVDHQLGELRQQQRRDAKAIRELQEKRETLRADSTVVDRADERGWDELKAVVEHDLEGPPRM